MKSKKIGLVITTVITTMSIMSSTSYAYDTCASDNSKNQNKNSSYTDLMLDVADEKTNFDQINFKDLNALNQDELNNLTKKAIENKDFNLIIDELYKNKLISIKEYKYVHSNKIVEEDYSMSAINFRIDNCVINFTKIGDSYNVLAIIEKNIDNVDYMEIYNIKDNELNLFDKTQYNKESNKLLKYKVPKRMKRGVPSFKAYGNWCGPGYSGPGDPVDGIDRCCMKHDKCYEAVSREKDKEACDVHLIGCVEDEYDNTSRYGKVLIRAIQATFNYIIDHRN